MRRFKSERIRSRHVNRKDRSFYDVLRLLRDVICSMRGITVGTTVFRLPIGVAFRIDEVWMPKTIQRLLPETEGIFLDVGVNLGQTLLGLRSVDSQRRYVGFEPNVYCVSVARRIIEENDIDHSIIIPAACSDKFGVARLFHYLDSPYDSTASMVPKFRDSENQRGESVIVSASVASTLDAIGIGKVGIVKIDVEGFEADVLEALETILSRDRPFVLVEVLPIRDSSQRRQAAQRIMVLMERLRFVPFEIIKNARGQLVGFRQVVSVGEQQEVARSDFLFSPVTPLPSSISPTL